MTLLRRTRASAWVGDIAGMAVVNRQGKRIGDVDKVVRRNEDGQPYAVISVGGFLGIGDKDIAVALDKLRLKDEKVVLPEDGDHGSLAAPRD